jgi:hypothetical protein
MTRRQSDIACLSLCVLLLSACAGQVENKRFEFDGKTAPVFTGSYKRDIFLEGSVEYEDAANTQFDGKFDSKGYPRRGELTQYYQDANSEMVSLKLSGDFILNAKQRVLSFEGSFTIADSDDQILAHGEQSQWLAHYTDLHPFRAPPLMTMEGDNEYLQYRRNISPKDRPQSYPIIHRGLPGPFRVDVGYKEGLPRGVVKISAQMSNQDFQAIERQYFNYQIESQPVQYFYYEPGSFSKLEVMGDCGLTPNLTVPQQLLQAYVYDCDTNRFYALSDDYPASVLQISAKDIDNGGVFRRLWIYHHGEVTRASVNVDAIYDGKWLYHGPVKVMYYGNLQSYTQYELGKPIGIGIRATEGGAEYVSFGDASLISDLPDDGLVDKLDSRYEWYKQRLNLRFSSVLADTILSSKQLSELRANLLQDIDENKAIAKDGQVAGLSGLWASWQRQSTARLSTWGSGNRKTAAVMKSQLLDDLEKWYEQSRVLLNDEATQRCARLGQSLNYADWRCENKPEQSLVTLCERYLDKPQCDAMSARFANKAGSQ